LRILGPSLAVLLLDLPFCKRSQVTQLPSYSFIWSWCFFNVTLYLFGTGTCDLGDHIWLILALACLDSLSKFIYLLWIYFFLSSLASSQHCLVGFFFFGWGFPMSLGVLLTSLVRQKKSSVLWSFQHAFESFMTLPSVS
jgi:hypothetical protein